MIKITKKERKKLQGPNAMTMRSINSAKSKQYTYSDGTVYMGLPPQFMNVGTGLGLQKMVGGLPFVKVQTV